MATKKIEEGKKAPARRAKKAALALSPEKIVITLALAQTLGTPHDEESCQLTIRHKELDPWSHKLQSMRVTSQKQHYI